MDVAHADRLTIVKLLSELPEFETESGRRRLVELAGLSVIAPHIDLSGPPFLAAAGLLDHLARYGRLSPDAEALGLLLNVVISLVNEQRAGEIAELLRRYSMMIPVAAAPRVNTVGLPFEPGVLSEKIIGLNTLKSIAFLSRGLAASRAVALVQVNRPDASWTGSGFLVASGILMTNNHVVGTAAEAAAATVRFGFEEDEFGRVHEGATYPVAGILATDIKLDYCLLQVDGLPDGESHTLVPRESPVQPGERVNIIQHPGGQSKQISLQHNLVEYVGGEVVQYVTSTLPGSSGSPVLDDEWRLVAIHHAGGMLTEPTTGASYYRNEGISILSIAKHLPADVLSKLPW